MYHFRTTFWSFNIYLVLLINEVARPEPNIPLRANLGVLHKHFPEKIASNLKFLNNLQPEWSRHVTIVHQTKDLHTDDYTQLYDFLKYNQKEVDELKAERLAKTQDPLALMANSNNPYAFPAPHQDQSSFNQYYMQQPIPNPEDITDLTTAMNMALALMAKAFKLNYSTPTNNNQWISSNPRNRQIAQPGIDMGQDRQMQMVGGYSECSSGFESLEYWKSEWINWCSREWKSESDWEWGKEEAEIQLQAEEYDLKVAAAYLDEIEKVNANCILMANLQQASTSAGYESRPPMLNKENYVPWSSRLLRYAKSRPNGKLIHNFILNGPYVRRMIPELGDANRDVTVTKTFHVQIDDELSEKELKQIEADDQAIQTILLGLPEDIYAAVDSCETTQEIWLRVQQMMKGSNIGIQEKKAKLFNEWEMFTSNEGESIESYYHRFLKLMNDLKRNKHFSEKIASNLKFLNNLQPKWSRHVTIVHQTKDLHTDDYTELYDFLKYNQKEVDELKAERLTKTQDPLALMANSNNPYAFPAPHQDQSSFNQNYMQQPILNPEDITDLTTAMNMALALMAKAFKLNYSTPTKNNQWISSNPRNRQIAQPGIDMGQDRQMQMVGDLDEIEKVNANCILMANLQQASTSGTQTDNAPVYDSDESAEEKSTVSFLLEDELLDKQIQLEKKIKELNNILLKTGQSIQMIHMLSPKPDSFYHTKHKMALGYQNPFYLKQAQKKQQSLYDGKVLLKKHDPPVVHDSEETLQLAQESHEKMKQLNKKIKPANYTKINHLSGVFVPQMAMSHEELYFLNNSKTANVSKSISIPNDDFSDDTTPSVARKFLNEVKSTILTLQRVVKHRMTIKTHNWSSFAHQELHKIIRDENFPIINQVDARVQNFEIQFLKEATKFVGDFKSLTNEADVSLAKHKALEVEIERLLKAVVSQDIMNIVQKESVVDTSDL
nr:hypothetical protein [Tanacetum cinerariifolium]